MYKISTPKIPLILISGLLCDALLWAPQIGALSDIADSWVVNPTNTDNIGSLAKHLLEHSPFDKFALAGLSMGGYVALEVMRQAPGRVLKLALMDTNARADTAEQTERRRLLIGLARRGGFPEVVQSLLPALVNRARAYDKEVVGTVLTMARNVGVEAFYRQEEAIIGRPDSRSSLSSIQCPTLLLCGRQDVITPVDLHQEIANGIKGARLAIIEDCGHLSTIEQPEEVNAGLRAWLAR